MIFSLFKRGVLGKVVISNDEAFLLKFWIILFILKSREAILRPEG
jgi:hypothetical protein